MTSLPIIVDFQVLKERVPSLHMSKIDGTANAFLFKRPEEGFHQGIIPTIAFAGHADHDAKHLKLSALGMTRVLTSSIAVMQESCLLEGVVGPQPSSKHFPPTPHREPPDMAHPTTAREYTSRITARYSQLCAVGIDVISVTHFWFGSVAVNSRFKMLGATG